VHDRHAAYYTEFAERSALGMTGPEQAEWAGRIEREYQNVRGAFGRSLGGGDLATAARLCLGLWRYWRGGSHIGEGRDWLAGVLSARGDLGDAVGARVLHAAAVLAATQDEHETAYRLGGESLRRAEAAGDRPTTAQARNALGIAAIGGGDYRAATDHFQQSLAIWRELGQPQGTAIALGNLTKVALRLGDIAAADGYADQCLALERAAGNTRGIVLGLACLGQIRLAQGDAPGARAVLEESVALSRTLGDLFGEATALHQLAQAARSEGDEREALRLLTAALARRREVGDREDLAVSLDSVADLVAPGDPALAARLLGAAHGLRDRHRLPVPPEIAEQVGHTTVAVRAALAEGEFAAAWTAGRTAPLDVIVDQVLDLV